MLLSMGRLGDKKSELQTLKRISSDENLGILGDGLRK